MNQTVNPLPAPWVLTGSVVLDVVAVALFVVAGRLSHDEPLSAGGLGGTAWPFLIGLVGGYVGIALTRWPALGLRGGAVIVGKTAVIGLVLRYGVARDETPPSFVLVTVLVLTALLLGWRLLALAALRRSAAHPDGDPAAAAPSRQATGRR